ncbi:MULTISPECIES: hypothetical protein [unclassified Rhizobium]|jgi:hypothetical protein|uniref:hypothetical protein n=1 Tax=unclassified Rhizobium TaxID=2613769 RepID=UPI000DD5E4B1|nr:hypothetical protein [Rhizobium sp. UBA1881]
MGRKSIFSLLCLLASTSIVLGEEMATGPYSSELEYLKDRFDRSTTISSDASVGLIRAVELVVSDQVDDKCFTNVGAVSARIRALLENAGIPVYSEPLASPLPFNPKLFVVVLGFRAGNGPCVASAEMSVEFGSETDLGSLTYTRGVYRVKGPQVMWRKHSLFSRGDNANEVLLEKVQEWTDSLTADIAAARRDPEVQKFLGVWSKEPPQTAREFQAEMDKTTNKATSNQ